MPTQQSIQGRYIDQGQNPIVAADGPVTGNLDPLSLNIPDDELVKIIDRRIRESRDFYKTHYDLYTRRERNELYYFGRQITQKERDGQLKDYESRNQDNVLYEIEATIKPLAMSQLPDMIVLPGENTPEKREVANQVSKAVDTEVKNRNNRKVLALAFKHLPVYFTGVIKVRWDPEASGGLGDYVFEAIHPDNIDFDHTCPTNNADDMSFVAQSIPMTVKDALMRFPKSKDKFIKQLQDNGIVVDDNPDWKALATEIRITEVWFTWYEKAKNTKDSDNEFERVEGVIWKYEDVILEKMKNPNYDYQGKEFLFTYDVPGDETTKRQLTLAELQWSLSTGQFPVSVKPEQKFFNYFPNPAKPFFFMGYDQWGKQPLDETSRVEQNIHNQDVIDKRGKQINETLDERGHHIWSEGSGFSPDDVEKMDHNDPDQDYWVAGSPNDVHAFIPPARPGSSEFQDLNDTRQRMYALSGSTAIRGTIQSEVATTNQIAREANFTRADDLVEDTVNAASEWMAAYALQFIKLRYTVDHWRRILGARGDVVFIKLNRDMIDDGMEVKIKASGTDKIKKQNNAMDMARMQLTDPLNFFRDMGFDDYAERTRDLILFTTDPKAYMEQVVQAFENPDDLLNDAIQNIGKGNFQPNPQGIGSGFQMGQPTTQNQVDQLNQMSQPEIAGAAPQQVQQQPSPNNTAGVPPFVPTSQPNRI